MHFSSDGEIAEKIAKRSRLVDGHGNICGGSLFLLLPPQYHVTASSFHLAGHPSMTSAGKLMTIPACLTERATYKRCLHQVEHLSFSHPVSVFVKQVCSIDQILWELWYHTQSPRKCARERSSGKMTDNSRSSDKIYTT